jgi:hypothetical protein
MPEVFELEVRGVDERPELELSWLDEDSIELGPAPRPWAWQLPDLHGRVPRVPTVALLAAVLLALAIAAGVSVGHPSRPSADVSGPSVALTPPPTGDFSQLSLASMVAAAQSPIGLTDYAIEDNSRLGCQPDSATGLNPAKAIAAVVGRYQPQFRVRDSSMGLEQSGVCSAQVRFATPVPATLLIITVIPPPNDVTPFVAVQNTVTSSATDIVAAIDGWRIEVGAVGAPGTLPTQNELTAIATDARIRW